MKRVVVSSTSKADQIEEYWINHPYRTYTKHITKEFDDYEAALEFANKHGYSSEVVRNGHNWYIDVILTIEKRWMYHYTYDRCKAMGKDAPKFIEGRFRFDSIVPQNQVGTVINKYLKNKTNQNDACAGNIKLESSELVEDVVAVDCKLPDD